MKRFFDNVRDNNKPMESMQEEKDALRTDLDYLGGLCRDKTMDHAGRDFFWTQKARLFNLLYSM